MVEMGLTKEHEDLGSDSVTAIVQSDTLNRVSPPFVVRSRYEHPVAGVRYDVGLDAASVFERHEFVVLEEDQFGHASKLRALSRCHPNFARLALTRLSRPHDRGERTPTDLDTLARPNGTSQPFGD